MLTRIIIITVLLWAGMILGISFLESWVKFTAPLLTKPIGLDVGRTVFSFFHKVQCGLLLILIFTSIFAKIRSSIWIMMGILTCILILQMIWLFPILNHHVDIIISGNKVYDPYSHALYGIFEIIKVIILISLGMKLISQRE